MLGFTLSLASALCFGLYVLPRRRSDVDPWTYSAAMGLAVCALGGLLWLVLAMLGAGALPWGDLWRCGASALIWFISNVAYVLSIDRTGVARANAIKNLTALFGTVFGLLGGERMTPAQVAATLGGSVCIVAAALFIGGARRGSGMPDTGRPGLDPVGVAMGLVAAAGIGYYLVPALPVVREGPLGWVRYQAALGVIGGAMHLVPYAAGRLVGIGRPLRPPYRVLGLPALAGALWFLGSALVTPATALVGLAISWPLSQLSFYVTLAWGVAVFREIDLRRSIRSVWAGSACTLAALVLFGLAKA